MLRAPVLVHNHAVRPLTMPVLPGSSPVDALLVIVTCHEHYVMRRPRRPGMPVCGALSRRRVANTRPSQNDVDAGAPPDAACCPRLGLDLAPKWTSVFRSTRTRLLSELRIVVMAASSPFVDVPAVAGSA